MVSHFIFLADVTEKLGEIVKDWAAAISDPLQKLAASAPPEQHISEGLTLLLAMVALAAILGAPVALQHKGGLGEKAGTAFNAVFSLITSAIIAAIWHWPFKWLGGHATFAGSYLAYCYGYAPYVPLITFAGLITAAGLPRKLRPFATNPATAQKTFPIAWSDPEASKPVIVVGTLATWTVLIWSTVVMFRAYRFEHDIHGWRYGLAIGISLIIAAPIGTVFLKMIGLFIPPPAMDALTPDGEPAIPEE
jgi:hypothetical protein